MLAGNPVWIDVVDETHWHKLRQQHIGASEVASLFPNPFPAAGEDEEEDPETRWGTPLELYRLKAGLDPAADFSNNERIRTGQLIEPVIAQLAMERLGFTAVKETRYAAHPTVLGMGASLDYRRIDGLDNIECKNVSLDAWYDKWMGPNGARPPAMYWMQAQHQMAVTRRHPTHLSALVAGSALHIFTIQPDLKAIAEIEHEVDRFWTQVTAGTPPHPHMVHDAWIIQRMFEVAPEDAPPVDLATDPAFDQLCADYRRAAAEKTSVSEQVTRLHSSIILKIGSNKRAVSTKFQVSAPLMKHPKSGTLWRKLTVRDRKPDKPKRSRKHVINQSAAAPASTPEIGV